jgi:hypothetical protein
MNRKEILTGTMGMVVTIGIFGALSTGNSKAQNIIQGKIWSGADTVKLGNNDIPDSLKSITGDTVKAEMPAEKLDWSSGNIIELPAKEISPKTRLLKLSLSTPPTLKFIPDAPIALASTSSDPEVVTLGESESKNPEKPLIFPLVATTGKADLFLYYKVVCCTTGPEGICFFKEARLKVPVTVGDFDKDVLEIRHEIEY